MEDTLPAVDLHPDVQLKVDVALDGRAQEAAAGGRAGPALAEQLADGGEPRGLLVGRLSDDNNDDNAVRVERVGSCFLDASLGFALLNDGCIRLLRLLS